MCTVIAQPPIRWHVLSDPRIVDMPSERMAVVETFGDPSDVGKQAIQALYGAVYTLKFAEKKRGRDFKVMPLRARWSDLDVAKRAAMHGLWARPVPAGTRTVPQKHRGVRVSVDTWRYGRVAEIQHLGPYSAELPTIRRLLDFSQEQGYEVDGPHEEEYLTRPDVKLPKTLIRYRVRKRSIDSRSWFKED